MRMPLNKFDAKKHMADVHGFDQDPFGDYDFKETRMKLTKQKLKQLIMEEYVRKIGDENKPTNYPEFSDKLTTLNKDDYLQARELAGSLDEPLNIELSQNEFQKIDMPVKHGYDTERFQFIQESTITGGMYEGMISIFFDKKRMGGM